MPWKLIGEYMGSPTKINDILAQDGKVYLIDGANGDGSDEFVFTIEWMDFLKRCIKAGYEVNYPQCTITEYNLLDHDDPNEWNNIFKDVEWDYYDGCLGTIIQVEGVSHE